MTTVSEILREVEAAGCEIKLTGEYLELSTGRYLPKDLITRIKHNKPLIVDQFQREKVAREAGFICFPCEEFFSCQYGDNSFVFIQTDEEGNWNTWRESWRSRRRSETQKNLATGVPFDLALLKASDFLAFVNRKP